MKDPIKQSLIDSTNNYRKEAGLPMIEAHDEDEARLDALDRVQETLQPYRDEYAKDLWDDPAMVIEAFTEALNSPKNTHYISSLKCGSGSGNSLKTFINQYFDDLAEKQYQSLDDL